MTTVRALIRRLQLRSPAWLIALALLLPLAQGAAAMHALQHAPASQQQKEREAPQLLHTLCVTCLAGSAVSGGAPPPAPPPCVPSCPATEARVELPVTPPPAGHAPAAYQSRAPPLPIA